MAKFEKFYNGNLVAILYSPGYGGGWFTWNSDEGMIFDKEIVEAVLDDNRILAAEIAEAKYDAWTGGANQLQVEWLQKGTLFRIREYDGNESVQTYTDEIYYRA